MDVEKLGELVGMSVATGAPVTPEQLESVLTNEELLQAMNRRGLTIGSLAVTEAESLPSVESAALTPESFLSNFDTAYQTYSFLIDATNGARAEAKGRKKPSLLEAVDADDIRKDVEALLTNEVVIAELQTEIDYFTTNPEIDSPAPGFDLVIVPEGLTISDEEAIAKDLQAKLPGNYQDPYIRPARYNDPRTPEVTGKGYRLAFAPRHYNVPKGIATNQTNWMNGNNHRTAATELQTATDAEAMAYINGLVDTKQLDNPATRFDQTYFRRFDQAPHNDRVSSVYVLGNGLLRLAGSNVHHDDPARALVVPKA